MSLLGWGGSCVPHMVLGRYGALPRTRSATVGQASNPNPVSVGYQRKGLAQWHTLAPRFLSSRVGGFRCPSNLSGDDGDHARGRWPPGQGHQHGET